MTAEQLPLLSIAAEPSRATGSARPTRRRGTPVPAKLRLDAETRRIGLAGLAEVRRILAEQEARHRAAA